MQQIDLFPAGRGRLNPIEAVMRYRLPTKHIPMRVASLMT